MNRSILVIVVVFLIHFLPFLLNGNNAYIRIHDNLEGEWIWLDLLIKQGKALDFSPLSVIDNVMNGQPRAAFPSGLSLNVLLIYLFGNYWGYITSYFFQHLIAFGGMYLLLRQYFLAAKNLAPIAIGVSLCFSLVPFYLQFGVFALPLLLLCFLNVLNDSGRWIDFLLIFFFPLFSSMVWTGISALTALLLLWFYRLVLNREFNFRFLLAILLLTLSYCIVNIQLLSLSFFNKEFISHRIEYNIFALQEISFIRGFVDTLYPLLLSHYHVGTMVSIPIFVATALGFYYSGKDNISRWLLVAITVTCIAYGFYMYVAYLLGGIFPILITFKANRFIILLPLVFFLLFSVSLKKLAEAGINQYALNILLACQLLIGFFSNDEWLHNMRNLLGFQIKPGYREFYAENLFKEIDNYIGKPKNSYRVAGLGLNTGAIQFNGFYTLDGLLAIYSLDYKKQFREVIAPEIKKNREVKNYFDAWGNRCYIFSSELGIADRNYLIGKNQDIALNNFTLSTAAFKQMGGKYLFSAVMINTPEKTGLRLLKIFEDNAAWWRVYLYEAT